MKATLEFQLPDETNEFYTAARGQEYRACLWDIFEELRRRLKYGEMSEAEHKALSEFAEAAHELVQDRNLDLD